MAKLTVSSVIVFCILVYMDNNSCVLFLTRKSFVS